MWENPVGLDGFEFLEFTSPDPKQLATLFEKFGFKKIGVHKTKDVHLFRQNDINFIINNEKESFGEAFRQSHGPSICAMGVRVKDAAKALEYTTSKGARKFEGEKRGANGKLIPAIYGIGDSLVYFVDTYGKNTIYDVDFNYTTDNLQNPGKGFLRIDHLTNNVGVGKMGEWCDFYSRIFNFRETRYFDIRGAKTGLISKVMSSPCGKITIPINEPSDDKSQIQEYINEYKGFGIQHVAFLTSDIVQSLRFVRDEGIEFLETPDAYYDMIAERPFKVQERLDILKEQRIQVDGDKEGYLLQIFTKNLVGPIFIELIQRRNHAGFGEGNFQALFNAIERDQMRRGVL